MRELQDYSILYKLAEGYPESIILVDEKLNRVILLNKLFREQWGIKPDTQPSLEEISKLVFKNTELNPARANLAQLPGNLLETKNGTTVKVTRTIVDEAYTDIILYKFKPDQTEESLLTKNSSAHSHIDKLLNTLPLPIFFKDLSGVFTGCNSAFEKFMGISRNKIIGEKIYSLLPLDIAGFYNAMDSQLLENPGEIIKEGRLIVGDGKHRDIVIHKATFNDTDGNAKEIVGVILDITEQKNIQNVLKESEKELEELNATKDKFFSILAHDLKNPFSVILGITNFLIENYKDFSDEEVIESLQRLNNSSRHLFNLFENLLEWSRIQRKSILFHPVDLNLHATSKMSIHPLVMTAAEKKVNIVNSIPEDIDVIADEKMLETTFRNLISNAIKYSNKQGTIDISAKKLNTDFAEITISDDGIGMDKETIDNLFSIEYISSKPGTEKEQGTGLGLILCYEFIKQNGGDINVNSETDKGSKFVFTIPLTRKNDLE